jgi:O-acetyl-ADP-ribose deacetylase (regulator of RNase III)
MTVEFELGEGDMIAAEVEALVCPVSCVGVMDKDHAFAFKKRFPRAFTAYAKACERGEVAPGRIFVFDTGDRTILHFPTKRHFRDASTVADIDAGLTALVAEIESRDLRTLAIPALGCGAEGLDWDDVRPRIEEALAPLRDVRVQFFPPA